jgi:3-hydroxy-9,10-secoandrosta-1,3,5(10)-triene-9,17-dione monooxygenase
MLKTVPRDAAPAAVDGFDEKAGEDAIAAAMGLRELLRAEAAGGDARRYPSEAVIRALDEADLWAVAVPKRLGGRGASALSLVRMGAELAKGDPSVAWVSQIINGTTWVTSLGPDALQDELFANGVPRIAGAFNPPGTAIPVDGGYRVTGSWPYASGIRHTEWSQWGIKIVHPDGTTVMGNFCYIPTRELTIEDSWYVTGLQGTGSDTATVTELFVPEHRVVHAARSFNYVEPGKRNHGAPSDYFAQMAFVHRTMTGTPLGAAEALLETVSTAATAKPLVGTIFARQSDSQVVAKEIGEAGIKIHSARLLIEDATRLLDVAGLARRTLSERERACNKAQANYAIQILAEAVQTLMFVAGSGAFNDAHPAARYWRDFNMVARHFGNIPAVGHEVYGRSLLGITPSAVPPHMY